MNRIFNTRLLQLYFLLLFILVFSGFIKLYGSWSPPDFITGSDIINPLYPEIIGDQYGGLHLFFGGRENLIYYTTWNRNYWEQPLDILIGNGIPSGAVDDSGNMHLIWLLNDNIYYSWAPIRKIGNAMAWATPIWIASGAHSYSLTIDKQNHIHIVYQLINETLETYYTRSINNGLTWQPPILLLASTGKEIAGTDSHAVDIVSDGKNNIHLVISWKKLSKIFYIRSTDNGLTWENPIEIAPHQEIIEDLAGQKQSPTIAVRDDNEIHIFFFSLGENNEPCARYHQLSLDNGENWSNPVRILDNLINCTGPIKWAIDGDNTLHIATSGRGGIGNGVPLYSSYWTGEQWSTMSIVIPNFTIECPGLAIVNGNLICAVGCLGSPSSPILYSMNINNARYIKPNVIPTETPSVSTTPLNKNLVSLTPEKIMDDENNTIISNEKINFLPNDFPIVIGVILSVIFIFIVMYINRNNLPR